MRVRHSHHTVRQSYWAPYLWHQTRGADPAASGWFRRVAHVAVAPAARKWRDFRTDNTVRGSQRRGSVCEIRTAGAQGGAGPGGVVGRGWSLDARTVPDRLVSADPTANRPSLTDCGGWGVFRALAGRCEPRLWWPATRPRGLRAVRLLGAAAAHRTPTRSAALRWPSQPEPPRAPAGGDAASGWTRCAPISRSHPTKAESGRGRVAPLHTHTALRENPPLHWIWRWFTSDAKGGRRPAAADDQRAGG
jgi:hypothetical protein